MISSPSNTKWLALIAMVLVPPEKIGRWSLIGIPRIVIGFPGAPESQNAWSG